MASSSGQTGVRQPPRQLKAVAKRSLHDRTPLLRWLRRAAAVLPNCDVAIFTGTAIINHTLGQLLDLAGSAREVVLLGAFTPMAPRSFAETPVTLLAGVQVADAEQMLRTVSAGGSTRQFGSAVRKLCARVAAPRDASFTADASTSDPPTAEVEGP